MKNIFLIGDSIRLGYDAHVRNLLLGKANVFYPQDNCRFAQYTHRHLGDWRNQLRLPKIDIIHWNNGAWDTLHQGCDWECTAGNTMVISGEYGENRFCVDPETPPEVYALMIGRVHTRIQQLFPGAVVIFATSTPVLESKMKSGFRYNSEIQQYNQIAREVLAPCGVLINDLHAFAEKNCENHHADCVHYTEEGSHLLATEIVDFLENHQLL